MRKYKEIMAIEWKNALAYRADTWLKALFSVFRVALAYLLWSAVFRGAETYAGMTLPEMTTYYLIAGLIAPLTQGDGALWDFSNDIRSGRYAKYIVRPASPFWTFQAMNLTKAIFPVLTGSAVVAASLLLFPGYFAAPFVVNLVWGIPTVLLCGLFNGLINYIIASMTFRFTDVSGFYILNNICKDLLSGAMIPLNILFGQMAGITVFLPFSYIVYYPAMLLLGRAETPPPVALAVLCCWILIAYALCRYLERTSPSRFEGVGL